MILDTGLWMLVFLSQRNHIRLPITSVRQGGHKVFVISLWPLREIIPLNSNAS